jgi:hypothetical protein
VAFDPFKRFEGWNETEWIKTEVEKAFAKGAHVSVKTLRRALNRVVADGHYGPIDDEEHEATMGYRMSMVRALDIIADAQEAELPAVRVDDPDHGYRCSGSDECQHEEHAAYDEPGPLVHTEPVEIERDALVRWYFDDLVPIYGTATLGRRATRRQRRR